VWFIFLVDDCLVTNDLQNVTIKEANDKLELYVYVRPIIKKVDDPVILDKLKRFLKY